MRALVCLKIKKCVYACLSLFFSADPPYFSLLLCPCLSLTHSLLFDFLPHLFFARQFPQIKKIILKIKEDYSKPKTIIAFVLHTVLHYSTLCLCYKKKKRSTTKKIKQTQNHLITIVITVLGAAATATYSCFPTFLNFPRDGCLKKIRQKDLSE